MNKSPFRNDPFVMLAEIFDQIYPNHPYDAYLISEHLCDEDGTECYGVTNFPEDGSTPEIILCTHIPYESVIEIFAHELAHLATSDAEDEHGIEFEEVCSTLNKEFDKIMGNE